MVIDGHGNQIENIKYKEYGEFLCSFLKDDRAKHEMMEAVDKLLSIDTDTSEDVLYCLEAVFGYESGTFKGNDYFAECYWDNYQRLYKDLGNRQ